MSRTVSSENKIAIKYRVYPGKAQPDPCRGSGKTDVSKTEITKMLTTTGVKLRRPSVAPAEDPELWAQKRVDEGNLKRVKSRQLDCLVVI